MTDNRKTLVERVEEVGNRPLPYKDLISAPDDDVLTEENPKRPKDFRAPVQEEAARKPKHVARS